MTTARAEPEVRFAGTYWFPMAPGELWDTLERFDRYPGWWAWLRDFDVVPTDRGLVDGAEMHGTVVPPVPYRLSLQVTLDRCRRPARIEATIGGDLRGHAVLELEADGEGTTVSVTWTLHMVAAPLRLAARVAYPLVRWGHDQVVAMAVAGFRRRAFVAGAGELERR